MKVANIKSPATPKRIEKLDLTEPQKQFLNTGADIRADRLAEFIILVTLLRSKVFGLLLVLGLIKLLNSFIFSFCFLYKHKYTHHYTNLYSSKGF